MATLRVAAPSRASVFARGTATVAPRAAAARPAVSKRASVTVRAGFFDFLQPKEEEAPAVKSGGVKSICLDCGYIAGASRAGEHREATLVALCGTGLTCPTLSVRRVEHTTVDLAKEPFWYKCPVCGVGKNRFKPAEEAGACFWKQQPSAAAPRRETR